MSETKLHVSVINYHCSDNQCTDNLFTLMSKRLIMKYIEHLFQKSSYKVILEINTIQNR